MNTETTSNTERDFTSELEQFTTTSAKIRYLNSQGLKNGPISKLLNIRYQHVRNVLTTPLKKS